MRLNMTPIEGAQLRAELIRDGRLIPAEQVPDRLTEGLPFLPIDAAGRRVAAQDRERPRRERWEP